MLLIFMPHWYIFHLLEPIVIYWYTRGLVRNVWIISYNSTALYSTTTLKTQFVHLKKYINLKKKAQWNVSVFLCNASIRLRGMRCACLRSCLLGNDITSCLASSCTWEWPSHMTLLWGQRDAGSRVCQHTLSAVRQTKAKTLSSAIIRPCIGHIYRVTAVTKSHFVQRRAKTTPSLI